MANNNDNKVLNVPPLRFPEFTREWKEEQLECIATFSKGVGISKEQLSETGEQCILYGELYTKYKSEIIKQVESKTLSDSSKLKRSKANDVIIPCSGETAVDIATARCVPFDNILLGGGLNIISLHKYDGAFMSYQLNGKRKYDIAKVAQGVSVVHLYGEHLKTIKTYNPTLPEQQKIAKLLSLLDERIATQNKIIERLQSLMSGIRHNVFTRLQNGNLYKLGEFLTEYSERNRGQELPSVAVGKYGIRKRTDIYSKELSKDYSNNKVIYKNTLTIGMGSSQIDIGILLGDEIYCVSPAYTTYRIHDINPAYLQEFLIHINSILSFKYMITSVRQGKSVNKSALLQHKIFVCNENEQNTIQYAFKIIKEKIAIEQNILKDLIGQKKYLLSKMFI